MKNPKKSHDKHDNHGDKIKPRKKPPAPKPSIGAGSFFDHLEKLNRNVEIFDAQIRPLNDSRQGALDDVDDFLAKTNIAKFVTQAVKSRLDSGEHEKKYPDIMKAIGVAGGNAKQIAQSMAEMNFILDDDAILELDQGWYLTDEKGAAFLHIPHRMNWYVKILQDMGIDKSKISRDYWEQEGRPAVSLHIKLDDEVIQSLINKEADRRFFAIPEVMRARDHIKGLIESGKALGNDEISCEKAEILKKVAGHQYEQIAEQVYKEALGKARFQKPFDDGLGGDDKKPDIDPTMPHESLVPSDTSRLAR